MYGVVIVIVIVIIIVILKQCLVSQQEPARLPEDSLTYFAEHDLNVGQSTEGTKTR
jgi:hypothetical protein